MTGHISIPALREQCDVEFGATVAAADVLALVEAVEAAQRLSEATRLVRWQSEAGETAYRNFVAALARFEFGEVRSNGR